MPQLYTPTGRLARSLLMHIGNMQVNQIDNGTLPPEFFGMVSTITPPLTLVGTGVNAPYTHPDAPVAIASAYDELIIDVQPTVTYVSGGPNVSTANSYEAYMQAQMSSRPFWVTILPTGYGVPQLYASRTQALATAQAVMAVVYADVLALQLLPSFLGFAFVQPDLNVMFSDYSVIDRLFQGTLIQQCWTYGVGACIITARPADTLSLIAPTIAPLIVGTTPIVNPNTNAALANPILGCNVAIRDKLVVCYPNDQIVTQNISVVLGQVTSTLKATNRDPGFTRNLDVAYVLPIDDVMWTVDGTGGVTPFNIGLTNISVVLNFVAALGITSLGVRNKFGSVNFPAPSQFMPADANINTTGSVVAWSAAGQVYVAYAAPSGGATTSTVRQFSNAFQETTYIGPPLA